MTKIWPQHCYSLHGDHDGYHRGDTQTALRYVSLKLLSVLQHPFPLKLLLRKPHTLPLRLSHKWSGSRPFVEATHRAHLRCCQPLLAHLRLHPDYGNPGYAPLSRPRLPQYPCTEIASRTWFFKIRQVCFICMLAIASLCYFSSALTSARASAIWVGRINVGMRYAVCIVRHVLPFDSFHVFPAPSVPTLPPPPMPTLQLLRRHAQHGLTCLQCFGAYVSSFDCLTLANGALCEYLGKQLCIS